GDVDDVELAFLDGALTGEVDGEDVADLSRLAGSADLGLGLIRPEADHDDGIALTIRRHILQVGILVDLVDQRAEDLLEALTFLDLDLEVVLAVLAELHAVDIAGHGLAFRVEGDPDALGAKREDEGVLTLAAGERVAAPAADQLVITFGADQLVGIVVAQQDKSLPVRVVLALALVNALRVCLQLVEG